MIGGHISFKATDGSKLCVGFDTEADYSPDILDDLRRNLITQFSAAWASVAAEPVATPEPDITVLDAAYEEQFKEGGE